MAMPSVDISESIVPFLGLASATIKSAMQINLKTFNIGLNLCRQETGHRRMSLRLGNLIAARVRLRALRNANNGKTRSNKNIHGE
jgi:hypothetical protein